MKIAIVHDPKPCLLARRGYVPASQERSFGASFLL